MSEYDVGNYTLFSKKFKYLLKALWDWIMQVLNVNFQLYAILLKVLN